MIVKQLIHIFKPVIVVIIMSYLLIVLSFHDLIGESRGKNLKHGFPIKTFGNDEKVDIIYI